MLASIFRQLGGQGHVAGFMAGDNGHASGAFSQGALNQRDSREMALHWQR